MAYVNPENSNNIKKLKKGYRISAGSYPAVCSGIFGLSFLAAYCRGSETGISADTQTADSMRSLTVQ